MTLHLSPHLAAHVLSDREVGVFGEDERFAFGGAPYARILPLIDGTRSADDIVAAVPDLSAAVVYYVIERLKARGVAVETKPGELAPSEPPPTAPVTVLSAGVAPGIVDALGAKLPAHAAVPLTVILVDDYFRPEIGEAARVLAPGSRLLPVRPVGDMAWFGPLLGDPDHPVQWGQVLERLRMTREADWRALAGGAALPLWPAREEPRSVDLALAFAARLIERIAVAMTPRPVAAAITTLDVDCLDVARHVLPGPASTEPRRVEIVLEEGLKRFTADGGHRTKTPHETLERLQPLISPVTGIVGEVVRLPGPEATPVFGTVQRQSGRPVSPTRNRILGSSGGAGGKGESEIQAKVSCIAEAVERYSCGERPDPLRRRATMAEIGEDAIHPNAIQNFSEAQFDWGDTPPAGYGVGYNTIAERFDPTISVEWTPVWSLTHGRVRWVPAALCHFGYTIDRGPRFGAADSNGCAAGNTLEEAILQGLLELVERDACALWWYNRLRRPAVDTATLPNDPGSRMRAEYARHGRTFEVLDLTHDLGIPVVATVSWRADGTHIFVAVGAHTQPRIAISRAACELNQLLVYEMSNDDIMRETEITRWLKTATIKTNPYVVPRSGETVPADALPDASGPTLRGDIEHIVNTLAAVGVETLVLDHTHPEVGFPVVRVIAPGLRHFWGRLAPGRLYDVPVKLGWLESPLPEDAMNPVPFFL